MELKIMFTLIILTTVSWFWFRIESGSNWMWTSTLEIILWWTTLILGILTVLSFIYYIWFGLQ